MIEQYIGLFTTKTHSLISLEKYRSKVTYIVKLTTAKSG